MLALRTTNLPIRSALTRASGAIRMYSDSPVGSDGTAGATAQSQGWKKREQVGASD